MIISTHIEFDAGHRVASHDGKCRNPHGHRYGVSIDVEGPVPVSGMVLDFGIVKAILVREVHDLFDHGMIVHAGDTDLFRAMCEPDHGWRVVVLSEPPTAENIASCIFGIMDAALPLGIELRCVVVHETPNHSATMQTKNGGRFFGVQVLDVRGSS